MDIVSRPPIMTSAVQPSPRHETAGDDLSQPIFAKEFQNEDSD